MQSLTLTTEHISKLLEMCKTLFLEIKHWSFDTQSLDIGSYIEEVNERRISNHLFLSKFDESPYDDGIFIHWYEFCVTHLATKLYNSLKYNTVGSNNHTTIVTYRGYICQEANHPIDFLYEEFKKLT